MRLLSLESPPGSNPPGRGHEQDLRTGAESPLRFIREGAPDPQGPVWAAFSEANLLSDVQQRDPLSWLPPLAHSSRLVMWSGTPAAGLFDRDMRAWMPAARARFESWCDAARTLLEEREARVLFRPHCRHALCDPQRCLEFLLRREGQPFGLALDPVAMLEVDMLPHAEIHLERAFAALAPRSDAVIITNARLTSGAEDQRLEPSPLHEGDLNADVIADLARRFTPGDTPHILLDGEWPQQIEILSRHAAACASSAPRAR